MEIQKRLLKETSKKREFMKQIFILYSCQIMVTIAIMSFALLTIMANKFFGQHWDYDIVIAGFVTFIGILIGFCLLAVIMGAVGGIIVLIKKISSICKMQHLPLSRAEMDKLGLSLADYCTLVRGITHYDERNLFSDTLDGIRATIMKEFSAEDIKEAMIANDDASILFSRIVPKQENCKVVEKLEKIKGLACDGKSCSECEYTSDCLEEQLMEKAR